MKEDKILINQCFTATKFVGLGANGNPLYQHEKESGIDKHLHFIYAGGQSIAVHTIEDTGSGTTSNTQYLHRDHLGSVEVVTNSSGVVIDYISHDAWGKRRNPDWTDAAGSVPSVSGNIGFTGHEEIAEIGLVHMNGRVYDPDLGRFLSADPNIQFAGDTQSYNRYTYVSNNPLKYTDPSGYFLKRLKKFFKRLVNKITNGLRTLANFVFKYANQVAALVVSVFLPYAGQTMWASFGQGFLAGFIGSGGDLKAALVGGLTARMFHSVGDKFTKFSTEKVLAHGVTGGIASILEGGSFKDGFIGSAISQVASGTKLYDVFGDGKKWSSRLGRALAAAVVGGSSSKLTGGKFKNGAWTAAFGQLFNDLIHSEWMKRNNEMASKLKKEMMLKLKTAQDEVANIETWLNDNYIGFPDTNNNYVNLGLGVDMAFPFSDSIFIDIGIQGDIFQNMVLHEKLHVYLFQRLGSMNYLTATNVDQIHQWIRDTSADMGRHYRGFIQVNEPLQSIINYPVPLSYPEPID